MAWLVQRAPHLAWSTFLFAFTGAGAALAAAPPPPSGLIVDDRQATSVKIRWTPSAGDSLQGYKLKLSETAGVHPEPAGFPNGKTWAFTWTTDDGADDNMIYHDILSAHGAQFTAFLNSATIGQSGKLTWEDVRTLHAAGHEMGNHTQDHRALIDDRALSVRYVGTEPCEVSVMGNTLTTVVAGNPDLTVDLTSPVADHLVDLAAHLDAEPNYEATLLYADLESFATQSSHLDPMTIQIGASAPAGTLTTARGVHDLQEMTDQVVDCSDAIEAAIWSIDPDYRCRTLGYPNHAHEQPAMSLLNELGYIAARSGNPGERPFFSEGSFASGFMTTYEAVMNFPRPSNSWDEAFTRSRYQSRIASWKASNVWAILMAHGEWESDSAHVAWMMDEVVADPDVWIAPFGTVAAYLNDYYVDVGLPVDSGNGSSAWLHDLDPAKEYWLVITAYNSDLEESGWSTELYIPPFGSTSAIATASDAGRGITMSPVPFRERTALSFEVPRPGRTIFRAFDVRGAEVAARDLGPAAAGPHTIHWDGTGFGARLPAGVYFVSVDGPDWSRRGKVVLLR